MPCLHGCNHYPQYLINCAHLRKCFSAMCAEVRKTSKTACPQWSSGCLPRLWCRCLALPPPPGPALLLLLQPPLIPLMPLAVLPPQQLLPGMTLQSWRPLVLPKDQLPLVRLFPLCPCTPCTNCLSEESNLTLSQDTSRAQLTQEVYSVHRCRKSPGNKPAKLVMAQKQSRPGSCPDQILLACESPMKATLRVQSA